MKINSLFKREPEKVNGKRPLIVGKYSCPEFCCIKQWHVTEKVDGTNIRITWDGHSVKFSGRTKRALIPADLLNYLKDKFKEKAISVVFPEDIPVTLFGEGYGPKINSGGNYRKTPSFILFDVLIGKWWIGREDVEKIAIDLDVPSVPQLGIMTEDEVLEFVKSHPESRCSFKQQKMEGVVCRSNPLMLFRSTLPVMFKLICEDFKVGDNYASI